MMDVSSFDLKGGVVELWSLDDLCATKTLDEQASFLTEDMAMVAFNERIALDVGWYGDGPEGEFRISVIEGDNWESPIFRAVASGLADLPGQIEAAVEAAVVHLK